MRNRQRRIAHAFGYYGNKTNFFANRPKSPFRKIRQIYGQELERFKNLHNEQTLEYEELLAQKKRSIRQKIKKQMAEEQFKSYLAIVLSCFIILLIILLFIHYLPSFL